MNLDERFMAAFEGFKSAHGQTIISEERRAGKQKAQSRTVRTPITLELIRSHLNGVKGVGSIPINEDNKCKFGVLDIDEYPLDLAAIDGACVTSKSQPWSAARSLVVHTSTSSSRSS